MAKKVAIKVTKSVKMKNGRLVVIAEVVETVIITTEATMIAEVAIVVVAIMIVAVATNLGQANKNATTRIMVKESSTKEAETKRQERTASNMASNDRSNSVHKQQPWCIRSQNGVVRVPEKASSVVAETTTIAGVAKPPQVAKKQIRLR